MRSDKPMDLLELIRKQISTLPGTETRPGLRSVLHQIEMAYRRFELGQNGDDTFFTDTIYRSNQAFEGSAREAYRVLAGKDPGKMSPHQIEQYLDEKSIFRDRIL
jgi:hypothetical protein